MNSDDIYIDEGARWAALGGHIRFGQEPSVWRRKSSGGWDRKELVPFGKANPDYRAKYFRCADCGGPLLPTNVDYRFGGTQCRLVFGWSFGGL